MSPLPDNWDVVPFSSLATYKVGKTPSRANASFWDNSTTSVPWVSIADMRPYEQVNHTKERISEKAFHRVFRGRVIPQGTLLMSFKLSIGRVAFLGQDACHNEAIISIQPNKGVNINYLAYFLSSFNYSELYDRQIKGNTLNKEKIDRIPVKLPPQKEQDAIASTLDVIRDSIYAATKKHELLFALKHATMHKLFTYGLHGEPQKETEIGLVPESWEVSPLERVSSLERGRFLHRPRNEPRFYGGSMPFIQTGDVVRSGGTIKEYTQTLNDDGIQISRVFPAGTILITIAANIGYTGILQMEAACPDSLIAITPNEPMLVEYLHYYLQTQQPKMDQAAPKGTQKNINIQFLSPWPVPVPSSEGEQQEIVDILDAIDQKVDLHRRKKAFLEELFKSLLHKLMTGEIRVDDLDLSALEDVQPQAQGGAA